MGREQKGNNASERSIIMPKGSPSRQTVATALYTKKVGLISKSYKLRKNLVEDFARACEETGVSQAGKLSEMMQKYVDDVKITQQSR